MENTPLDFFEDQPFPVNNEPLKTITAKGCTMGCLGILMPYGFAVWAVYGMLCAKFPASPTLEEFPVLVGLSIMLFMFVAMLIPTTLELIILRKWLRIPKVRGRLLLLIFLFYTAISIYGLWMYRQTTVHDTLF